MAQPPPKRPRTKTPIRQHAVAAAAPAVGPKALRVGLLVGDRLVEERLLRERGPVTVGQSAKNTFSVPLPDLPRSFTIFPYAAGKYMLQFADSMDGRVSDGGQVWTLAQLKSSGKARTQGSVSIVGLPETARGKISVGEMTILFQFVTAPPLAPKVQLPASVRGRFIDRVDPYLAAIMSVSLLAHGVVWGYCKYIVKDSTPAPFSPDQFPEATVAPRPAMAPVQPKTTAKETEKAEDKKEPEKGKEEPKKERPKQTGEDASKATVEERVANAAPLRIMKTLNAKGNGGGVVTTDKEGWEDLGKGLSKVGNGEVVASNGTTSGQEVRGTGNGNEVAKGTGEGAIHGPTGPAATGAEKVEHEVKGGGSQGHIDDIESGGLDPDKVATTIKNRYQSRVIACYQRALKTNPGLGGKVTVNFTVGIGGNVVKAAAEGFDEGVDKCIEQEARNWRFEKPESPATFEIPFVLRKLN